MGLVVQKFGGSSVANTDRIMMVASRVAKVVREGNKVVVVLSAMGKTTDQLIDLAYQITDDPSPREMDMLMSTGEQVSIALFSMAAHKLGLSAISLTGPQVGILAEPVHRKGRIIKIDLTRLEKELKTHDVVAVAGFQGVDIYGDIVTLGRGGSDTSAVALATALKANICEIYTDVDGVYTADPRLVPESRKLKVIACDEMLELASSGAKVLQSRSVEFAGKYGIKIHVRSSFNDNPGTIIMPEEVAMEKVLVRGLAHDLNEAKITVKRVPDKPGIAAKIFGKLADANIVVDMIIQNVSEDGITDMSFTVPAVDLKQSLELAREVGREIGAGEVTADSDIGKVSVVGIGMRTHAGVAAKTFAALAEAGVNIEMISTSEIRISCVIRRGDVPKALRVLHKKFNLDRENSKDAT